MILKNVTSSCGQFVNKKCIYLFGSLVHCIIIGFDCYIITQQPCDWSRYRFCWAATLFYCSLFNSFSRLQFSVKSGSTIFCWIATVRNRLLNVINGIIVNFCCAGRGRTTNYGRSASSPPNPVRVQSQRKTAVDFFLNLIESYFNVYITGIRHNQISHLSNQCIFWLIISHFLAVVGSGWNSITGKPLDRSLWIGRILNNKQIPVITNQETSTEFEQLQKANSILRNLLNNEKQKRISSAELVRNKTQGNQFELMQQRCS